MDRRECMQTLKADCPNPGTTDRVISQIMTAGTTPGSIVVTPDIAPQSCHIMTTIDNDGVTLLLVPGQRCSFAVAGGDTQTYAYFDPTTFKINTSTGTALGHFQAHITYASAPGVTCDFEEISTYTKDP